MKLKLLSGLIVAGLCVSAFADTSSSSNTSTNNSSTDQQALTAQQKKELLKLKGEITSLKGQVDTIVNSPTLSMMAQQTDRRIMSDAINPLGMMPDTTFSSVLLQARQQLNAPVVVGGYLEADAQTWGGNSIPTSAGTYHDGNSIYLTTAKLYTLANINSWTSVFLSLQGNTNSATPMTFDQAFVTVGNLQKYPLYLMVGKGYLPFGSFAGNGVWSNSITTNDFRMSQANQINLGFYQNGLTLNIAGTNGGGANGVTTADGDLSVMVYNANYAANINKNWNYSVGASYINDLRGTESAVGDAYETSSTSLTGGENGAYDFNGALGYKAVSLNAEYASTTKSATYNGASTGKISSWMTTVNYAPTLWGQETTFSLGYSKSYNASDVPSFVSAMFNNMPTSNPGQGFKSQWIAFAQRPVYTNVYLGPEVDYAKTYAGLHTWTGTLDLSAYF